MTSNQTPLVHTYGYTCLQACSMYTLPCIWSNAPSRPSQGTSADAKDGEPSLCVRRSAQLEE